MKLKQLIALFSSSLILFSCAQIRPITGGEKDNEPPTAIKTTPKYGSIKFIENTITIEFNEFIKLTNVSNQLIVSPLMDPPPEILVRGKKLVIKLENELAENTTYSINFGNAISDITENNIFPNYKYVFSTGDYIDSLSYSGTVVNAFDLSKTENIYVLLYDQFEDSVPYKDLPRYVALTDKQGNFSITNIANGKYKFFAINDVNGNYLFDLPNETIGFKKTTIQLDSNSSDNIVYLFEEESGEQYVIKAENKTYGKIDVILNLPTKKLNITPLNQFYKQKWYMEEPSKNGDSLTLWLLTTENVNNLKMLINDDSTVVDTLDIDIIDRSQFNDSLVELTTNLNNSFDLNKNILVNIGRPFSIYNSDSIKLYEDSTLITNTYFVDIGLRKFELAYDFKENTNYQLFISPGAIEDIYGLKNDTVKIDFKTRNESDYGVIKLSINPNFSENYIIQLYKKGKLIRERFLKGNKKIKFQHLLPGNYELKLIIDHNTDSVWNTGNYLEDLQPEKVIFYKKEIKIRANWDNDIIWTVNE